MIEVVILGAGNVASHLFKAFSKMKNLKVIQVYNHRKASLKDFEKITATTTKINELKPAHFYILALKDDSIQEIAKQIGDKNGIVLHTSGAVGLDVLEGLTNFGVFYPLQTFSKEKSVNFSEIPICIEANSEENLKRIKELALKISADVREINSAQRKALHLAAVFVNNFSNHLYSIGAEICREHEVEFNILQPLIKETASKVENLTPQSAQTGPALREDRKTINAHLALLPEHKKNIYKLLTQSIQELHGKKL
jgi:predicted short-subunit dehydrogenase-like oxidoreductase (DUF2520 family)